MGLDINLNTSKIDISEEDGLNVDLYNDNIDISDDEADDIVIEITGLKSINKFIGLEDTPLYYDNGKFFKVEDNKIVYANIQWKDISGDISESPEIVAVISDLVNEVTSDILDERINLHNLNTQAHPFIQNIIQENYNTLDTKIDETKEELSQSISNLNDTINQEINDRETADNALSEDIQEETLARIESDTTLQNNIDTLTNNLNTEIENRTNADNLLRDDIDDISGELAQEILNRQTQDNLLQEQITSNYNTLDGKIDTEISNRTSADTTLQNNIDAEASTRQNADTELQNNIDELTQTVEDNNTAVNNRIDETNDIVSDLSDTVTSNYNTLDGKIDTEISNRTSADTALQNNIDTEASTRQNADTVLQNNINILSQTVTDNNTAINNKVDGINTALTNSINSLSNTVSNNYTTLDTKIDNTKNALDSEISDLSDTVSNNYTTLNTKIDNTKISLEGNISDLSDTVSQNYTDLSNAITSSADTINSRIDSEVSTLNTAIGTETTNRQNADNNLQSQIDAIVSSSDVFDIVGTYAELQAYDISTVPANDIIKVLVDSSHDNTATYYRCIETEGIKSWSYIGSEGAYYTKSESDTKFVAKTTTINNIPLSSNITLTASDVNALPDTTVIGNGVLTLQKNGVNIDTFNANATANKSINITVPTDTADLTNGAGFITSASLPTVNNGTLDIQVNGTSVGTFTANQSGNTTANIVVPDSATWGNITGTLSNQIDLQNALNSKYDASNPDGYITTSDLPTNYVTTDTAQDISGRKTFLGEKAIYFKQQATSNKLGFTLYNPSNTELGALEYRPSTIGNASLLAINCPQSTGGYVGFRYWGSPAVNIVAPKVATAGNYYIPTHITNGSTTVTASNNGTVNISTLLPDVSNFVTNSSLATTLADYVTNSALTTTLSDYALLTDIPTVGNGTITINQGGTQKGTFTVNQSGNTTINLDTGGGTVDQTFDGTSANAQSGVAISNAKFLQNTANHDNSLCIYGTLVSGMAATEYGTAVGYSTRAGVYSNAFGKNAKATGTWAEAFGGNCDASGDWAIRIGHNGNASGLKSIAIGASASASANYAIQLGEGTNSTKSLQIGFGSNNNYILLDGKTGLIPDARISSNIARISNVPTIDQTFDGTSANAQSGVAISNAKFLQNTATGSNSITILGTATSSLATTNIGYGSTASGMFATAIGKSATASSFATALGRNADASGDYATAIGESATASNNYATAIGERATASGNYATALGVGATASGNRATALGDATTAVTDAIALGHSATASGNYAIQIGSGTNSTKSLQIGFGRDNNYILLDGTTGLIPDARLSSNIARTSQIPSISNLADKDLSNLSTTGQAIIDGKADTTLSNVSSIDSSSAVATALDAKVNNDDYYYNPGDTDSYSWYGGGYITSSGTEIWFTLPTPKSMANVTTVTCTALTTAFRKSNGGYMPSSGGNGWNAKAKATVTIGKLTENTLALCVKYNNFSGTNNTPVGVLADISLSFT